MMYVEIVSPVAGFTSSTISDENFISFQIPFLRGDIFLVFKAIMRIFAFRIVNHCNLSG